MQSATVVGRVTATVKHSSLEGWRMFLIQPWLINGEPDGPPQIAIDQLGSKLGDRVLVTTDGAAVKDILGRKDGPVRYAIIGIEDNQNY
jgi:ethanolamine utilization protein EutN